MKNLIIFFKKYKYLIFILLISLTVYFKWLSFSIFAYSDYSFRFANSLIEIPGFGIWSSFGVGSVNLLLWRLAGPNNLLFGLFGFLGFDSNIADKFIILWPWVILSGVSSYFLVRKITKSEIGGLVGSFVFAFSTYFLASNRAGHLLLSTASVFAVLSLLFFIKSLEEKKRYLVILTAFFLFFTGANDFRVLYMIIWLLFFYTLYYLIIINKFSNYKEILKNILIAFSPIIIIFLLNIFWIIASLKVGTLVDNPTLNRSLFGNSFFDITKAITLFHPFWTGGKIDWFIVQKIPFYFWLIPIFALLGLILNRKNKKVLFFGLISLLGIFLSKQISEPFGSAYKWLFEDFPGFNAFREASKFYFIVTLGYSVLIGAFIAWLWRNWNKQKWQIYSKYFLTFLISIILLWNAKPIVTGEIESMFVPRHVHSDYLIFKGFVLGQEGSFRNFWVPIKSKWNFTTNKKREISHVSIIGNEWKGFISGGEKYNQLAVDRRNMEIFKIKNANELFDSTSIKYVIVPINDFANDADPFYWYGRSENPSIRDWYINELDKINFLEKIDIGTEELVVYENKDFRPHIYATQEKETVYREIPYEKVKFEQKNPTEYKVLLKNISQPAYLNFSESYHPDWKVRAGKFNWFNVLLDKNYFLPDKYHFKNNAKLNSFLINPEYIKQNFSKEYYKENPDGSIDVELTLYFKPQSYFYLGLFISGTTFLACLVYLGYDHYKRRKTIKG